MLYIPNEVTVGFKKMTDSFSGKKGFITYRELGNKNELLFNQSKFDQFVEDETTNIQIKNTPRTGFVINKKMLHEHNYFGQYSTILVYHPDGFEFEISLSNLMTIMEYSDINAQEIQQECILGWYRSYPVLMPTNCPLYHEAEEQNSELLEVTDMNTDLVPGRSYYSKKEKNLVYIGKEEILKLQDFNKLQDIKSRQGHIFLKDDSKFVSLAKCQAAYSNEIHPDFEHFKNMYEFQKAQIKIDSKNINLIKFSINSQIDNIANALMDTITSNEKYSNETNKDCLDSEQFFFLRFSLFNQLARNFYEIFKFHIYSEEQKDHFHLEILPLINDPEKTKKSGKFWVKFSNKTVMNKSFHDNTYYHSNSYRTIEVTPEIAEKLHKEFNTEELLKNFDKFFASYLFNTSYDKNEFVDVIVNFIKQFNFVGIQYAESENFDFALVHSFTYNIEKSSYQDFALDSTDVLFKSIKDQSLITPNIFIFNKSDSVILENLTC